VVGAAGPTDRARTVALTAVHGPGEGAASAAALEQVCAYLAGHGIAAEPSPIEAPDADVVDLLNARAQAIGADLIVTGAYGQSRLREWVFGGVTRRLMDEPRTWLFMSH
ncbi:MAG TPA: universal stress protein, partial [Phenylobacterium sp.]|nr:universal stress protein [Phenylobacterium sp.]